MLHFVLVGASILLVFLNLVLSFLGHFVNVVYFLLDLGRGWFFVGIPVAHHRDVVHICDVIRHVRVQRRVQVGRHRVHRGDPRRHVVYRGVAPVV